MSLPAIIMIGLYCMCLGIEIVKNGEPKKDNHSFGYSFLGVLIQILLLYWGGFFD